MDKDKYGICIWSMIPIRTRPSEDSEMSSQLLFGECYAIVCEVDRWIYIRSVHDNYEGWIDAKLFVPIEKNTFYSSNMNNFPVVCENFTVVKHTVTNQKIRLSIGSILPNYDEVSREFIVGYERYYLVDKSSVIYPNPNNSIEDIVDELMYSPYLWGGRMSMGIDCSGFAQLVYRFLSYSLPRDASQQVLEGETISHLNETKCGDLAFFGPSIDKITHVGIMKNNHEIWHASGWVKCESITSEGIINNKTKKCSHNLQIIKRFFY